jgi:3-oxoadipate enol-lactonase
MPFIRVNGLTVHYQLEGPAAAPVILFGNSLGTNLHLWDAQLPVLRERFRLLRYDMRGHGMTDAPAEAYTIDLLADDALGLLDALKLDKARYCGLSIGGMIGQRLGAKAPGRFLQLALCNTGMSIGTPQLWQDRIAAVRQGGLGPMVDGVMQRWFTPASFKNKPELLAGYRNMLVRTPADGYIGCCRAIAGTDLAADVARIACPTLVVVGADDAATPPELGRAIARTVKGAKLVEIAGAGHISAAEQPAAVNAALAGFFQ